MDIKRDGAVLVCRVQRGGPNTLSVPLAHSQVLFAQSKRLVCKSGVILLVERDNVL